MDRVIYSISPILTILKILGIIPLNLADKKLSNYVLALISFSFWTYNFAIRNSTIKFINTKGVPIITGGIQVRCFLSFILLALAICGSQIYRNLFERIVRTLANVDKKVRKENLVQKLNLSK